MTILVTMCKLFVAMALGFLLRRQRILDGETSRKLSSLIIKVTSPFLIVSSVTGVAGAKGGDVLKLLGAGVVFYGIFILIGFVLVRILPVKHGLKGVYSCMIIFSNNTFMGFPVLAALLGDETLFYAAIFNMPFNLVFFSLGLYLIQKDATQADGPQRMEENRQKFSLRSVLNNGVIAAVLALVVFFSGIKLPALVTEPLSFIGGITMPLSMMVIGSSIAGYSLKEVFSQKMVYLFSAIRLAALPLLSYFAIQLFTDNPLFISTVTITVGMPVASLVAMGAAEYEKQAEAASAGVAFSTLCSMLTIPVMALLLGLG